MWQRWPRKEEWLRTGANGQTATNIRSNFADDNNILRHSIRLNNICSSDGISKGDEDMLG
jgi:hypothetical protein